MSCYISSNDNRLYAGSESSYGRVPSITDANRFPAVRLGIRQLTERIARRDKTGSRSYAGSPAGTRRQTSFDLSTYLTGWTQQDNQPGYGPLFQAALGSAPLLWPGGTIAAAPSAAQLQMQGPHGLISGQAVAVDGEIRFVTAIIDTQTVEVNAPFTVQPTSGTPATPTATYLLGKKPGSVSIFDYWSPAGALQRVLCGSAIEEMGLQINGDFHEFRFSGPARDVLDSATFTEGQGELTEFPAEPEQTMFDYSLVPGHLGQVWLGAGPDRFYTLTSAGITMRNNLDLRAREFGSEGPRCIAAGERSVSVDFEMFGSDQPEMKALYEAARQRSPIKAMFQLGQQQGQLFGIYMKSLVPEAPEFDDSETRLLWKFLGCRAQGSAEDEMALAFA
jgi:hypothetical protein